MLSFVSGERKPRAHFSGIGGTGMVAVARLAIEAGWEVRGSDNPLYPPTSDMVRALDIPFSEGYAAANLDWAPDVVVIGNALSRGNEEIEAVLERGLPYMSYPEWLKFAVLPSRHSIVIAGTHGKTTTTALAAHLLDHAGKAPGFLIGGQSDNFAHSSRLGAAGAPFVIEGDEYDTAFFDKRAKFFHYLPRTAVVTSLELDHADIYRNVEEIEAAFRFMLRQIPASGRLILCADSPRAAALREHAFSEVVTYGFDETADWRVEEGAQEGEFQAFTVYHGGSKWGEFRSPLYGRHNLQNTLAAIVVAHEQGVDAAEIATALLDFKGVRRRMDVFLKSDGILFIDDFAHHPTAIRETIAAVRARWPGERLTVLFDPGRTKRGLVPNMEEGLPLTSGRSYRLTVSSSWLDAQGEPLAETFEKRFTVTPSDFNSPMPPQWKVSAPAAGTIAPVVVALGETVDRALALRLIDVLSRRRTLVVGEASLADHETRWSFTPKVPWRAGQYRLRVDGTLEDPSGN
ncbi:MAG: hypothetical protein IID09_06890, partial [Candidatus Hydrogenedentes bacterium]|nr:hypothetical protein [Candidatus Hydrogenedentota bacterium]